MRAALALGFLSGRHAFGTLHNEGTLPRGRGKVGSIAMYRRDIRLRIAIDLMEERSSPTQDTEAREPFVALGWSDVSNERLTFGKRG